MGIPRNASTSFRTPAEVAEHLHAVAIHLLRRVRRQDVASELSPARLSALSVVVFGGPQSLRQLADAEQVRPPTMSRIVAALERKRLVERTGDSSDGRKILLRATSRGVRLMERGRARRIAYLSEHLRRLSSEELRTLGKATEILRRLLQDWV